MGCLIPRSWVPPARILECDRPCPPPGDLPDPGIEPVPLTSPALAGGFFTTSATWEVSWQTYEIWKEEKAAFRAQISGKTRVSEGSLAPAGVFPRPQT